MTAPERHETERRSAATAYWIEQMDAGSAMVERVLAHPVEDDGEPLVDVVEGARAAGVELRCSPAPHAFGRPRMFLVRASVLDPLLAVAADLRALDHTLVVEDAFRTREMQRDIALVEGVFGQLVAAILRIEPDADPETVIRRLSVAAQARPKGAGHMAGAAVDVSVVGPDGELLDRGGPYPTVSEKMPMDSPFVSEEAARNRRFVSDAMARHGFAAFAYEFWHYSRDDAFARVTSGDPRPARYGPLDRLPDGRWVPAADQLDSLHDHDELVARVERAMRAGARR